MSDQAMTMPEFSKEELARHKAGLEIASVLTNLDHALGRAKKALAVLKKSGADPNGELALQDLVNELQATRRRFVQETYYKVDDKTRLF